jgi:6-phosphogluconolactonase (cycloisomerase 2 family)
MKNKMALLLSCVLFVFACTSRKENTQKMEDDNSYYLLVGSYSDGTTPGISVYSFDEQTGDLEYLSEVKDVINPSYLVVAPSEKLIYSVNETSDGAVTSFSFDKITGTLNFLNYQSTEGGGDPCYISINKDATFIATANYSGGNVSVFPLTEEGSIAPLSQCIEFSSSNELQPSGSHIHTVMFSPDGKFLFATDLGKDKIYKLKISDEKTDNFLLYEKDDSLILKTGSGPRHLVFHPNRNFAYCINELSGTVTVFEYKDNTLHPIQYAVSDTTSGIEPKGSADIHLSPDGRFLYSSNRLKADGIAIFSVDQNTGMLTKIDYQQTGIHPRNFIISPNGKFLLCANRDSNTIQIFEIISTNGLLHSEEKEIFIERPVCLKWISKRL